MILVVYIKSRTRKLCPFNSVLLRGIGIIAMFLRPQICKSVGNGGHIDGDCKDENIWCVMVEKPCID
jgi:hypothetical protein